MTIDNGEDIKDQIPLLDHAEKCVCPACVASQITIRKHLDGDDLKLVISALFNRFVLDTLLPRLTQELSKDDPLTKTRFGNVCVDIVRGWNIGVMSGALNLVDSLVQNPATKYALLATMAQGANSNMFFALERMVEEIQQQAHVCGAEEANKIFNEFLADSGFPAKSFVAQVPVDRKPTIN